MAFAKYLSSPSTVFQNDIKSIWFSSKPLHPCPPHLTRLLLDTFLITSLIQFKFLFVSGQGWPHLATLVILGVPLAAPSLQVVPTSLGIWGVTEGFITFSYRGLFTSNSILMVTAGC